MILSLYRRLRNEHAVHFDQSSTTSFNPEGRFNGMKLEVQKLKHCAAKQK